MAEYAGPGRVPNLIRLSQELISSVPSIVVGLFGLALFVNATHWSFTALAGALALTVFNLPLMTRLAEQAIRAVPGRAGRQPGPRHDQVADNPPRRAAAGHPGYRDRHHPHGRAHLREAAALLFTAGLSTPAHYDFANFNLGDPRSPWSPFHPATTLSVYIWKLNSEGLGQFVRQISDASAAVLVVMVLVFNLGARGLGRLLQRRVTGAG